MRIVFFMRNVGYVRNFEWVLNALVGRGHHVRVVFDTEKMTSSEQAAAAHLNVLRSECPGLEFDELLPETKNGSLLVIGARYVRLSEDYLRYLAPTYADAPRLRARCGEHLNPLARSIIDRLSGRAAISRIFNSFLEWLDGLIPAPRYIVDYLREAKPDLVLVTPLLGFGSNQADYFKATRLLGIRSCLPVASWDNLTSKGQINVKPDRILVWNEAQKIEAVELHDLPPENVTVVGAHSYQHWFTWQPSTPRDAFLSNAGLGGVKRYILFLGSSPFIAPNEPPVVFRWLQALRRSENPILSDIGVLFRPHPQNASLWRQIDTSPHANFAVYPREGANPVSRNAKSEYFDSIYHCDIVVGANTSAMIEASILRKAVHTVLFDELTETQEGTPHFKHLMAEDNGLVHASRGLDEHVRGLAVALDRTSDGGERSRAFVERFVRPRTLEKPPAEAFVDALDRQLAAPSPPPRRATLATYVQRALAAPLLMLCLARFAASAERAATKKKARTVGLRLPKMPEPRH